MSKEKRTFETSLLIDDPTDMIPQLGRRSARESQEGVQDVLAGNRRRKKRPVVTREVILRLIDRIYQK